MKYRRISAVVEAWQNVKGAPYPEWLTKVGGDESGSLFITDAEGRLFDVLPDHWLVREDPWHFSVFSPKVFEQSFESVDMHPG